jgi:hypothetical protein
MGITCSTRGEEEMRMEDICEKEGKYSIKMDFREIR